MKIQSVTLVQDTIWILTEYCAAGSIDVKAANLLLTSNAIVKIADFGVSSQLTQSICVRNSVVVTPYW